MSHITRDAAVDAVVNHTTTTTTASHNNNNNDNIHTLSSSVEPPRELPHSYYATQVQELHESVQRAIDLVQYYSEQTERSSRTTDHSTTTTTNTTNHDDPQDIYQQLDTARNQITTSWQALYAAYHSPSDDTNNNNDSNSNPLTEQEQIRIAYLNMITDSFGNVLANLHDDNNNGVDVLADCLQSGYDLLTQFNHHHHHHSSSTWYDTDFVWNDDDDDDDMGHDDEDDEDDDDTPHERHRQQLGFQEVHWTSIIVTAAAAAAGWYESISKL